MFEVHFDYVYFENDKNANTLKNLIKKNFGSGLFCKYTLGLVIGQAKKRV